MIKKALDEIFNKAEIFDGNEISKLNLALGRVLAKDIVAIKSLPCFDNAAMDGYAFRFGDRDLALEVKGTIFAGDKKSYEISSGECYKIMTGAMTPKGADTIIELEKVKFDGELLVVDSSVKKHNAYRYKGEEIKRGETLLKKGEILTPQNLMYLASQGINEVEVLKKPKISLFSTGDEIIEPWLKAGEFEIYNANATGIESVLKFHSFDSKYEGIIRDDFDVTLSALKSATSKNDVVITSGGASKGEADFMDRVLKSLEFEMVFGGIDVRPGKPTKCYKNGKKLVFILPGNPMAAYLMAFLIVVPTLKFISSFKSPNHELLKARLNGNLHLKTGRSNIVLGNFDGSEFKVYNDNKFGSGMIKPLVQTNAIYISKFDESSLENGQILDIILTKA